MSSGHNREAVSMTEVTSVVTVPAHDIGAPPSRGSFAPAPVAAVPQGVEAKGKGTVIAPAAIIVPFYPFFSLAALWLMTVVTALLLLAVTTNELTTFDQVTRLPGYAGDDNIPRALTFFGVTQGFWKVCYQAAGASPAMPSTVAYGGPTCAYITSDTSCNAEFVVLGNNTRANDLPYNMFYPITGCPKINAMRAFIIIATVASVISMILMTGAIKYEKAWVWKARAASAFIIITAIAGMITMALARDHFGRIPNHNYGHSFWFIVIAWPLALVALGLWWIPDSKWNQEKGAIERGVTRFAATLAAIAFVFFLVAVCTNYFVYWTQAVGDRNMGVGSFTAWTYNQQSMGLWRQCSNSMYQNNTDNSPTGINAYCQSFDAGCESDRTGLSIGGCRELQAIRAMLILACFFSFISFIAQYLASPLDLTCRWYKVGYFSGVFALLFGFLTTATAIDWWTEPASHWGFSFWLTLLGWVLMTVSVFTLTWARWHEEVRFTARVTRFFAWIALLFQVTALSMTHWVYLDALPWQADQYSKYFGAGVGRPVQYGLWDICFDSGNCRGISRDTTCGFDSGYNMPALRDCREFNGIRGASLLSTVGTGLFILSLYMVQFGWCHVKESTARGIAGFWGAFAFFWGFIATGLAVNYFDVRTSEYAFSFWLFLTAWLCVGLSVASWIGDSSIVTRDKWSRYLQYALTLAAIVFFLCSIVISEVVRVDYNSSFYKLPSGAVITQPRQYPWTGVLPTATLNGNTVWAGTDLLVSQYPLATLYPYLVETRTTISHGFFYSCVHDANGRGCRVINVDCATRGNGVVFPECDQFNVARAFTCISLILVGISLVLRTINACAHSRGLHQMAGIVNFIAMITALVAIAVTLNWVTDALALSAYYLGSSTSLLICGWLITCRLALSWHRESPEPFAKPEVGKDGPFIC